MEDDIEEGAVQVQPTVVVNEVQFASLKEEAQPLPEKLDWRCAPQRGYLRPRCSLIHWRAIAGLCRTPNLYTDKGYG